MEVVASLLWRYIAKRTASMEDELILEML